MDIKNKVENKLSDIGVYGAIMIEGGASFIHSCLSEGVLQYLRIFSNDKIIGQDGIQFRFDQLTNYKLIYDNKLDNGKLKEKYLGDIIISYNYMNKPKNLSNKQFTEKTVRIFIHGFLHLLGYDHIKNRDYKEMLNEEEKIFKSIKKLFN